MLVVDASVLAPALANDDADGAVARDRLRGAELAAPQLIDLEVVSVLRRGLRRGEIDARRADLALGYLLTLRLRRASHGPLLHRCWQLRNNLTPYDAAYVALAELLGAVLVTADARLARAAGPSCAVELLA